MANSAKKQRVSVMNVLSGVQSNQTKEDTARGCEIHVKSLCRSYTIIQPIYANRQNQSPLPTEPSVADANFTYRHLLPRFKEIY